MISPKLRIIREKNRVYNIIIPILSKLYPESLEVYVFHDMLDRKEDVKSKFFISQESFEKFLINQLQNNKRAISNNELTNMVLGKQPIEKNTFFVTFDDCYEGVYTKAYPFLKANNISFIIYITQELIGREKYLKQDQIIEMSKDPLCKVGSHGCNHFMFRYLTTKETIDQLERSKQFLETLTNLPVNSFAFPYGRIVECSSKNIKVLSKSVYDFAFSGISGNINLKWLTSRFYLPRIIVDEKLANK